jgi:hypothetical protein
MTFDEVLGRLDQDEVLFCHFAMMHAAECIAEAWNIAPEGETKDMLLKLAYLVRNRADIFWTIFNQDTRGEWAEILIRFREKASAPPFNSELDVALIFSQKYDAEHRRVWFDYYVTMAGFKSRESFYRSDRHDPPSQASIDKWITTGEIRQDVANRLLNSLNPALKKNGHGPIGYWDVPHKVIRAVAMEEAVLTERQKAERVAGLETRVEIYEDACRGATKDRAKRWQVELDNARKDLKKAEKDLESVRSAASAGKRGPPPKLNSNK